MHVDTCYSLKPKDRHLAGPCNKQSSSQFFFDFSKQLELRRTLSLSQTQRSIHPKKDKVSPLSSFYSLKTTRTIKKLPPSHTHMSNTKRKKTLSSSQALYLSYFFYFILLFFKTTHIKLSILYYISLKY